KKKKALTKDGSDLILNGKLDWVYWEEVYDRKADKHYWRSPDGDHLAFVRLDDTPVPKATVVDYTKFQPALEVTRYPNVGDPNPLVKLAIASAATGDVRWVDLSAWAKDDSFIISRVGWHPDSKMIWFSIQDRSQTWLDFCTVGIEGGVPTKLLRDTTKAW